jgi:ELWxxDGT repeat protein
MDSYPLPLSSNPHGFIHLDGLVYFRAYDATLGDSLWRSDGTVTGTERIVDIVPGDATSYNYLGLLTAVDNLLFFEASHPTYGREFWRSDGTQSGTWMLRDIAPGNLGSVSMNIENRFGFNGNFYFSAYDGGEYGEELWRSDGSQENTIMVKDINPGASSSDIRGFAEANGQLFFVADDGVHGRELWVSDGTENGTNMVADINLSGSSISYYASVYNTALNGLVFFPANDGIHGRELWQSDGTTAGTVMVMDINPGLPDSSPGSFTVMENILYFSADDGFHGREIWALSHATLAQDDYVITRMGQPVVIIFLDNDNYLNPDQLTIAIASQPQHGQVVQNNATFIYTPEMGYIGADSFTYTLADGTNTPKMATIYISVDGRKLYLPFITNITGY